MLVLRPYSLPINPTKRQVQDVLGSMGMLLESHEEPSGDTTIVLKRWAREGPEYEKLRKNREFAIIRVFVQYIENNPVTDFNTKTRQTTEDWKAQRLSRIVTLWIPLGSNNEYGFLLSLGNIDEGDVATLTVKLVGGAVSLDKIKGTNFDFASVRRRYKEGWMHGCENRPKVIQRGLLYGDFHFDQETELNDFLDSENGTQSNQAGIVLSTENETRKVRVLRNGRFQVLGIPKEKFLEEPDRGDVMQECFNVARDLLKTASP